MEVKDMKMAKSVWKEKAGGVIRRLKDVCSEWSSILTTNFFRNEINRVLDGTAPERSRLEILHQSPIQFDLDDTQVTASKDEIFVLRRHECDHVIDVYDRNNMAEVKDVIPLPKRNPASIAACSVSNCVYVHFMEFRGLSILRITKDEKHQFNISQWIIDQGLSFATMSVSANGSLIILSNLRELNPALVSIYNANGSLQRNIRLLPDTYGFRHLNSVIEKSNGKLVVVSVNAQFKIKLTEIDGRGRTLRHYQSSLNGHFCAILEDIYGRILITAMYERIELLDSEFNVLDIAGPQLDNGRFMIPHRWHYNSTRNELLSVVHDEKFENDVLTIFRLTED